MDWVVFLLFGFVLLFGPLIGAALSVKVVPMNQRLVVERFGRFHAVLGPGLVLLIPFVDRATVVNLDARLPGWRELTAKEVAERLAQQRHDPQPYVRQHATSAAAPAPVPAQKMFTSDAPTVMAVAASSRDADRDARELVKAGRTDEAVKLLRDAGHGLRDARRLVEEMGKA